MYLYHYYDKRTGPCKRMTVLSDDESKALLDKIRNERPDSMCAKRDDSYIDKRKSCEAKLKDAFIAKGGLVEIDSPYYFVVEHSPWLYSWYEQPDYIKIPVGEIDLRYVSFTYGDSMPTFAVQDGKEYRRQVYTYDEILKLIDKYGLPQNWNDDGAHGPERYIEVHIWKKDLMEMIQQ